MLSYAFCERAGIVSMGFVIVWPETWSYRIGV